MNPTTISELYRTLRTLTSYSGDVHQALSAMLRYQPDAPVSKLADDEEMAIWARALNEARKVLDTAMTEAQATLVAQDHGID